ncbi:hypothetical protein LTR37_017604 [Vermiconidia calcicola]|uniref:Uncharacterized protein n=1 Tax=Vermiconidia calcicola TaxID=1690605 RepID=A0ACC3MJW2_9PEZI|nr:hypothetical protein LTR37_017604 [Vermiconidia calcicola]
MGLRTPFSFYIPIAEVERILRQGTQTQVFWNDIDEAASRTGLGGLADDTQASKYLLWTNTELRVAIIQRGLEDVKPKPSTHEFTYYDDVKLERINILTCADRSRTFPRFMELPPELQTNIYRHASVSNIPLQRPKVPAVCRLSKATREEALPIFFASNSFMITIQAKVTLPYSSSGSPKVIKASEIKSEDKKWLRMMRQHVALMRRFTVSVAEHMNPTSRTLSERYYLTEINFTTSMNRVFVRDIGVYERDFRKHAAVVHSPQQDSRVPSELDNLLKHIVAEGAVKNKLGVILQLFLAAF